MARVDDSGDRGVFPGCHALCHAHLHGILLMSAPHIGTCSGSTTAPKGGVARTGLLDPTQDEGAALAAFPLTTLPQLSLILALRGRAEDRQRRMLCRFHCFLPC